MKPPPAPTTHRRVRFKQRAPRTTRANDRRLRRTLLAGVLAVGIGLPGAGLMREMAREEAARALAARPGHRPDPAREVVRPGLLTFPAPAAGLLAAGPREEVSLPAGVGRGRFKGETLPAARHPWDEVFADAPGVSPHPTPVSSAPAVRPVPVAIRTNPDANLARASFPTGRPGAVGPNVSPLQTPAVNLSPAALSPASAPVGSVAALTSVRPAAPGPRTRAAALAPAAAINPAGQNLVVDVANGNSPYLFNAGRAVYDNIIVGDRGVGALTQNGGVLSTISDVFVGANTGANGTYTLSGGATVLSSRTTVVGAGSGTAGTFVQNGGVHATGEGLVVGRDGGGATYELNGGSLVVPRVTSSGGASTFNFHGGTVQAAATSASFFGGVTTANVRGSVNQQDGSGSVTGGAVFDTAGFNVTVAQNLGHSTLAGDDAADGGLTKGGAGTLTLTGANAYTGPTHINAGTLALASAASLGGNAGYYGGVIFQDGTGELLATANVTLNRSLIVREVTATFSAAPGATLTLQPASFSLLSNAQLVFGSTGNTGTVALADPLSFGAQGGVHTLTVAAGTLRADGNFGVPFLTSSNFPTTVAAGATLDFNGDDARGMSLGPAVLRNLQGAGTVRTGGDARTNLTVAAGNFSGELAGPGGFTKTTLDALTLSGPSTYAGGTSVNGGTLLVNNLTGSGSGSGPVQVNGGGTLGGTGFLDGAVTVGNVNEVPKASLAPGGINAVGTLTLADTVTFRGNGVFFFDLNSTLGTADRLVTAGLTLSGSEQFQVTDLGNGVLALGTVFTVIQNTGPGRIAGRFDNLPDLLMATYGANFFAVTYEGGDGNDLTFTVIPEPGTWTLLVAGGLCLLGSGRRRWQGRSFSEPAAVVLA